MSCGPSQSSHSCSGPGCSRHTSPRGGASSARCVRKGRSVSRSSGSGHPRSLPECHSQTMRDSPNGDPVNSANGGGFFAAALFSSSWFAAWVVRATISASLRSSGCLPLHRQPKRSTQGMHLHCPHVAQNDLRPHSLGGNRGVGICELLPRFHAGFAGAAPGVPALRLWLLRLRPCSGHSLCALPSFFS